MKCKAPDCDRAAVYVAAQLCQKHYFRQRRNGHLGLTPKSRKYRVEMPGRGYQRVYEPTHPLADKAGYVAEHRMIVYARCGETLPPCELCGANINWSTVHVDHIDNDARNNDPANLRPLCRPCNTFRDYPEQHTIGGHSALTFDGVTQTATEWARDPRVKVSASAIRRRLRLGASLEQVLFGQKKTHNGNAAVDRRPRLTQFKSDRKNAIRINVGGDIRTAAEWARHAFCQVSEAAIAYRIKRGWPHAAAVFAPPRKYTIPELMEIERTYKTKLKGLKHREAA